MVNDGPPIHIRPAYRRKATKLHCRSEANTRRRAQLDRATDWPGPPGVSRRRRWRLESPRPPLRLRHLHRPRHLRPMRSSPSPCQSRLITGPQLIVKADSTWPHHTNGGTVDEKSAREHARARAFSGSGSFYTRRRDDDDNTVTPTLCTTTVVTTTHGRAQACTSGEGTEGEHT